MNSPDLPLIDSSLPNTGNTPVSLHFENTYARLPERFYAKVAPVPVSSPQLIKINEGLAETLGLDPKLLASREGVEILSGNRVAEGSEPLAIAYAGHQFGQFVSSLGDGRANLLGEVIGLNGIRYDLQLKGSGPTPFSRRGDGRAALGPVLREYIVSEAMAAMGVPTTRTLAAVLTGESVLRETVLPGAILTRVASSHLRVGTFEYFAAREDVDGTRILADYAISRHYPEVAKEQHPYRALLDKVIAKQAQLIAHWMLLGFIHGVMNTDNTAISGETIDYGPCAFMETYNPATAFSFIDRFGRYAYGNQPGIALWNLARFAETLLPLMEQEEGNADAALEAAKQALSNFDPQFELAYLAGLRRKLGLLTERDSDRALAQDLLERMIVNEADFTLTFRRLCSAAIDRSKDAEVRVLFSDPAAYDRWAFGWRQRLEEDATSNDERLAVMKQANPAFIPRNHIVEAALKSAIEEEDFQPFEELLDVVTRPFEERPGLEKYAMPAQPEQRVIHTFCGT